MQIKDNNSIQSCRCEEERSNHEAISSNSKCIVFKEIASSGFRLYRVSSTPRNDILYRLIQRSNNFFHLA